MPHLTYIGGKAGLLEIISKNLRYYNEITPSFINNMIKFIKYNINLIDYFYNKCINNLGR